MMLYKAIHWRYGGCADIHRYNHACTRVPTQQAQSKNMQPGLQMANYIQNVHSMQHVISSIRLTPVYTNLFYTNPINNTFLHKHRGLPTTRVYRMSYLSIFRYLEQGPGFSSISLFNNLLLLTWSPRNLHLSVSVGQMFSSGQLGFLTPTPL